MKRFHVNLTVSDLDASVRFYRALFDAEPSIKKEDYAKWMLEDPRVNFAISSKQSGADGISHLGIQAENDAELADVFQRLQTAGGPVVKEPDVTCCYARSTKQWIQDPQGVPWETFMTRGESTDYGDGTTVG